MSVFRVHLLYPPEPERKNIDYFNSPRLPFEVYGKMYPLWGQAYTFNSPRL